MPTIDTVTVCVNTGGTTCPITPDYTSLTVAARTEARDIVSSDEIVNFVIYDNDGSALNTNIDNSNTAVVFNTADGWTTDSNRYVKVEHNDAMSKGYFDRLRWFCIGIYYHGVDVWLKNLQVNGSVGLVPTTDRFGLPPTAGAFPGLGNNSFLNIENCMIMGGVEFSTQTFKVWNTLITNGTTLIAGIPFGVSSSYSVNTFDNVLRFGASSAKLRSSTFIGYTGQGGRQVVEYTTSGGNFSAKNCYAGYTQQKSTLGFHASTNPDPPWDVQPAGTVEMISCGSSDGSCADFNTDNNDFRAMPASNMVFMAHKDLGSDIRPVEGSRLIDNGTDTSFESDPLNFTTDMLGNNRGLNGVWDIGCIEHIPRTIFVRTVGPGKDYATLRDFIVNEAADLEASGVIKQAECYPFTDDQPVLIVADEWNTTPNDYIWIKSVSGHNARFGADVYKHEFINSSGIVASGLYNIVSQANLRITGIEIANLAGTSGIAIRSSGLEVNQHAERIRVENCLVRASGGLTANMDRGIWSISNSLLLQEAIIDADPALNIEEHATRFDQASNLCLANAAASQNPNSILARVFMYHNTLIAGSGSVYGITEKLSTGGLYSPDFVKPSFTNNDVVYEEEQIQNCYFGLIDKDSRSAQDIDANPGVEVGNASTDGKRFDAAADTQLTVFIGDDVFEGPTSDNYKLVKTSSISGLFNGAVELDFRDRFLSNIFLDSVDTSRPQATSGDIGFFEVALGVPNSGVVGVYVQGVNAVTFPGVPSGVGAYVLSKAPPEQTKTGFFGGYVLSTPPIIFTPKPSVGALAWAIELFPASGHAGGLTEGRFQPDRGLVGCYIFGIPNDLEFVETGVRALIKATSDDITDQTLNIDSKIILKAVNKSDFNSKLILERTSQDQFHSKLKVVKFADLPTVFIKSITYDNGGDPTQPNHVDPDGRTVTVVASGTLTDGQKFESASIDFGDVIIGTTDVGLSGFTSDPPWTATHTYNASGFYIITAKGTDDRGSVYMDSSGINLASGLIQGIDYPYIDISGVPRSGNVPPSLGIDFTTAFSGVGAITATASSRLLWSFGNGLTSNEVNPSTEYSAPGLYIPVLRYVFTRGDGVTVKVADSLLVGFNK